MWLKELKVRNHVVIQQLELEFPSRLLNRPYGLDFIVGVNGTGKSTALRTIASLVHTIGSGGEPSFPFKLALQPEGAAPELTWTNMDDDGNLIALQKPAQSIALPPVILFTAGSGTADRVDIPDGTLEEAGAMSIVERLLKESPGHVLPTADEGGDSPEAGAEAGVGQVLTIRTEHIPLVLLCGWLVDQRFARGALDAAFQGANVHQICGFSIRLALDENFDEQDDPIALLINASSRQVRNGAEYLLVFDATPQTFAALIPSDGEGLLLYRKLLALFEQESGGRRRLDVDLFVQRTKAEEQPETPPLHLFHWLSDGEQAFLGRMSLFPLLGETQAIVLLDEPENHFNDSWKREIIRFLDHSMMKNHSHILISTHSSITLTDVPREHIHILQHDGCYTVSADKPSVQTLGADASEIMTEVFGTPQPTGRFGVEYIRDELEQIARERSGKDRLWRLRHLWNRVGPGYLRYEIRRELQRHKGEA